MSDPRDRFAELTKVTACYRDEGDENGEPLLLVMGLSSQLIHWPQELVDALGDRGYRVIRLDNRDSGLTSWKVPPAQYFLQAMADDALELLAHLGIDQAHVVGASMGGMISQLIAIGRPERVRTLCSIMSTTGDPRVGLPADGVIGELLRPLPEDPDEAIAQVAHVYDVIGSRTHAASERPRRLELAGAAYRRAVHPDGGARQIAAILMATDRTRRLQALRVPALVIHGGEDSLIDISGGEATHAALAGSAYLPLADMGHDLPEPLLDRIVASIVENAQQRVAVA